MARVRDGIRGQFTERKLTERHGGDAQFGGPADFRINGQVGLYKYDNGETYQFSS